MPCVGWGAQSWMHYLDVVWQVRSGGGDDSPRPLALPLLIQPRLPLALVAASTCCWPRSPSLPARTPRAVPTELLPAASPSPYLRRGLLPRDRARRAPGPPSPELPPPCPWPRTPFQPSLGPSVPAPAML